jgi:Domain of unknown function (DUF4145)
VPAPFTPPSFKVKAFHCPHCGVYARQLWSSAAGWFGGPAPVVVPDMEISVCQHCGKTAVWVEEGMVYPDVNLAPPPNPDLPNNIQSDYDEAGAILSRSPRGAAGLLRLAIQKLCVELGQPGKNINDDIAALVQKGLPAGVQQALDSVRVIGNEAVHPGQIDFSDTPEVATTLFSLINFICEKMISDPKTIEAIYGGLPPEKLAAIKKRDGSK